MDFSGENLPNLKSTIEERYPDVTVRVVLVPSYPIVVLTTSQVTVIQADAADDKAILDVCSQALREEGRLDIFFANVRAHCSPVFPIKHNIYFLLLPRLAWRPRIHWKTRPERCSPTLCE
jgi:hypothetical protein